MCVITYCFQIMLDLKNVLFFQNFSIRNTRFMLRNKQRATYQPTIESTKIKCIELETATCQRQWAVARKVYPSIGLIAVSSRGFFPHTVKTVAGELYVEMKSRKS